eukprot:m.123330 g.123330  ORF g.123330 m.123330 type:complete len:439 (-) comp13752_c0_seq1:77-1393(-)
MASTRKPRVASAKRNGPPNTMVMLSSASPGSDWVEAQSALRRSTKPRRSASHTKQQSASVASSTTPLSASTTSLASTQASIQVSPTIPPTTPPTTKQQPSDATASVTMTGLTPLPAEQHIDDQRLQQGLAAIERLATKLRDAEERERKVKSASSQKNAGHFGQDASQAQQQRQQEEEEDIAYLMNGIEEIDLAALDASEMDPSQQPRVVHFVSHVKTFATQPSDDEEDDEEDDDYDEHGAEGGALLLSLSQTDVGQQQSVDLNDMGQQEGVGNGQSQQKPKRKIIRELLPRAELEKRRLRELLASDDDDEGAQGADIDDGSKLPTSPKTQKATSTSTTKTSSGAQLAAYKAELAEVTQKLDTIDAQLLEIAERQPALPPVELNETMDIDAVISQLSAIGGDTENALPDTEVDEDTILKLVRQAEAAEATSLRAEATSS